MTMQVVNKDAMLPHLREDVGQNRIWLLGTGIFTMILGVAAILLPFLATLTVELFLAVIFMVAGIAQFFHAFQARGIKGHVWRLLAGVLYTAAGVLLIAFPLRGALTLTMVLAMLFAIGGVFRISLALNIRPLPSWSWLLLSGIISLALGAYIWIALPQAASWVLGVLVGIELIFGGMGMTVLGSSMKHSANSPSPEAHLKGLQI